MENLLKLLKEYAPDYCKDYPDDIIMDEIVISKRFGFIKWLVDEDKIDLWKLIMIKDEEQKAIVDIDNSRENTLLMLLAIQDKPIQFLCDILK